MSSPAAAIETYGLSREFNGRMALTDLTLSVPEGSFFGFLGPNGAGKSTTINILTGLLAPTSGTATVLGFDAVRQDLEVKRRIGVVPDGLARFADRLPWLSYFTISDPGQLAQLSELGVAFLLFMIGLELSWERLAPTVEGETPSGQPARCRRYCHQQIGRAHV